MLLTFLLCVICFASEHSAVRIRRFDTAQGLSSNRVGGGVRDSQGLMWFATWHGLNCYDGYDFHCLKIQPGDSVPIGTNLIRDIFLGDNGNIICHTDEGLMEFDLKTYRFKSLSRKQAETYALRAGRNWKGTLDFQGNLWTADRSGLYERYTSAPLAKLMPGTAGTMPRSFLVECDGSIMIGMRSPQGISVYDSRGSEIRKISTPSVPYCIFSDSNGEIWVGCKPGGLMKLDGQAVSGDAVYDIKEDSRGRLWVATYGEGIKCIGNPSSSRPVISPSIGGKKIKQLLITPSDRIIAATTEGLLFGKIEDGDFMKTCLRSLRHEAGNVSSLSANNLIALARTRDGNIYIATESSGINRISEKTLFSNNPVFEQINMSNSTLLSDICQAVTIARDSLLMVVGGDNVMIYNTLSKETVNLGPAFWNDTCEFSETTPVRLPDGQWAFAARQGVFTVTLDEMLGKTQTPLVFTTLSVNGGHAKFILPPLRKITLEASQRNITVGFAAIDFKDNSGILYRTRLDGSPWTRGSSDRGVTLFNLSPGEHILEVQSTDRFGRWTDNTRALTIEVKSYFYETWWARAVAMLIVLVILGGIIYVWLYIRRIKRQRRELLEKYMAVIGDDGMKSDFKSTDMEPEEEMKPLTPCQKPEDTIFLDRVRKYIEENINNPDANIDDMASASAASRSTLNRKLNASIGISAAQLLIESRMQRAAQLLGDPKNAGLQIAEVASLCGYSDSQYFQRAFKKKFGMTPSVFRKQHLG